LTHLELSIDRMECLRQVAGCVVLLGYVLAASHHIALYDVFEVQLLVAGAVALVDRCAQNWQVTMD
jgi:hypothetical protein